MNTNLYFTADGYTDGVTAVLSGFKESLDAFWGPDVVAGVVGIVVAVVVLVGTWYGVRAILRAMRAPK